jgi:hypothetical protein
MKDKDQSEDRKKLAGELVGGALGAGAGMTGAVASISAAGATTGLSGAGIASGLAAIGGGTMLGGLVVATGGVALLAVSGVFLGRKLISKRSTNTP